VWLMHGTCRFRLLVHLFGAVDWYMLLVQVDSDRLIVAVVDSVIMIGYLHLEFIFQGGWMGKGRVVVATF
jgi:hypothetical protein